MTECVLTQVTKHLDPHVQIIPYIAQLWRSRKYVSRLRFSTALAHGRPDFDPWDPHGNKT